MNVDIKIKSQRINKRRVWALDSSLSTKDIKTECILSPCDMTLHKNIPCDYFNVFFFLSKY